MPLIPISSPDDARLAIFRALPKSTLAQESGLFITEGDKVTERMFASRYQADSLLVEPQYAAKYEQLAAPELPIYVVPHEVMLRTVGFPFHRGVVGCGRRVALPPLREVVPPTDQPCLIALCPETQDPTNLGTILRTALALGVDAVLLGPTCADPFSRRVIRVSMGAALRLPLARIDPLLENLHELRDRWQIELCATVLDAAAEPLSGFIRAPRTAVLFGSEGHGLPAEAIAACPRRITIPMPPTTDSLNAAVAAGIFLHYFSHLAPMLSHEAHTQAGG
jgi:tRNA G18 (ribose-2'-O)-methylase SpoU